MTDSYNFAHRLPKMFFPCKTQQDSAANSNHNFQTRLQKISIRLILRMNKTLTNYEQLRFDIKTYT